MVRKDDALHTDQYKTIQHIQSSVQTLANELGKKRNTILPGLEFIRVFQLFVEKEEVKDAKAFSAKIGSYTFYIYRVLLRENKYGGFRKDLNIIKNELISFNKKEDSVYMDFIFWEGMLIGVLPLPWNKGEDVMFTDGQNQSAHTKNANIRGLKYYDFSDLWFDISIIQPIHIHANHMEYEAAINKVKEIREGIRLYLYHIYGESSLDIQKIPQTKFIWESVIRGFYYYRHFNLDDLVEHINHCNEEGLSWEGNVYVSLPSAYVPGKYIDMEYYNAILENEFHLDVNDGLLIVGYGTGIDLIHAAKRCGMVYGVEINPFSVVSARINLAIANKQANAITLWEDVRKFLANQSFTDNLPEGFALPTNDMDVKNGVFNKLLWNLPYEDVTKMKNPILMSDFHDDYPVLEWFFPLIEKSPLFKNKLEILFWNPSTDEGLVREYAERYGFSLYSDTERNVVLLSR